MPTLQFEDKTFNTLENEKILDAYLRLGISVPFSCRDGVCHSCKQIAVSGEVSAQAQKGLSSSQKERHVFLPCLCVPTTDMVIQADIDPKHFTSTILQGKTLIHPNTYQLLLEPTLTSPASFGQTINVRAPNNEVREFSITNHPNSDYFIEIHVPCTAEDIFSDWVILALSIEDTFDIQGPFEPADANKIETSKLDLASAPSLATDLNHQNQVPKKAKYPPPDPELWAALQEGELLSIILNDFYSRVYQDPLLAPYFHGTTMQRSIEKVFSFMQQVCTGDHTYFGERPKNTHHWMVISEDTYAYREALMMTCHRRSGLSEAMSQRWMNIERYYQQDIVKTEPWPREFGNTALPLDGYGEMVIDAGSICDGCGGVIETGDKIKYHLRLGTVYCERCNGETMPTVAT
jgi:ferredoxin